MTSTDEKEDSYLPVLADRYNRGSPLLKIFSERNKTETWRQLWIWLAEAEKELGLKQITQDMIDELKSQKTNIDWQAVRDEERRVKHDVMAHNHVCPKAAGIIHLGATSCYAQDNADLIIQRAALDHILKRLAICLKRLGDFANRHIDTVTVGRTHYQTASLVTVGKRACIWAQDLLLAFQKLEESRKTLRFRGIKGATGTQDSFLTLFGGDEGKVERLDELVTLKAGFERKFFIAGQTYTRQQDTYIIFALANLGSVVTKICTDIRFLQSMDELLEPFEEHQIGSSAMPYKKNPMKCERICGIARNLIATVQQPLNTLASQGLERTLDDSSNRRMLIPDAFLCAEAVLSTLQNVFEGLQVQKENVEKLIRHEIPFLALEKALMKLTEHGVSRQDAHAKIRETALAGKKLQATQEVTIEQMLKDPFFDPVRDDVVALSKDPIRFTGRCRSQVERFLREELNPAIQPYIDATSDQRVTLNV